MKLALCTIQRDRGPWLKEWFAFHHLMGVDKFYFFAHKCTDNTEQVIDELKHHFDITAFKLADDLATPQLMAYKFAYENFGHECDWMAFIDGDEFLFPTADTDIKSVLEKFWYQKISALAVYWACFGSSGHVQEPAGLITENYRMRAPLEFLENRHIKSIVMGRQNASFQILSNSHRFGTALGTFDEKLRPISGGRTEYEPSYDLLRINHYCTQSYEYFKKFKQGSGAADVNPNLIRPDTWWTTYDHNEVRDESLIHIAPKLKALVDTL